jgi:hypothetical protein
MGLFDFLRRNKKTDPALREAAMQAVVMGDTQKSQPEREMIESLGTNYHMMHDDPIELVLERDANINDNPMSAALRVHLSPLIRTAYIEPDDAEIYKLEAERDIALLEMDMDEETYEYGGSFLLQAYLHVIKTGYDDAKRGRKAQLLKVVPRVSRVSVQSETTKKQQSDGGLFI